jgi:hypothetical protein
MTLQKNWLIKTWAHAQSLKISENKLKFIYEQIYSFFWAKNCLPETLIKFEALKKWENLFINLSKFTFGVFIATRNFWAKILKDMQCDGKYNKV